MREQVTYLVSFILIYFFNKNLPNNVNMYTNNFNIQVLITKLQCIVSVKIQQLLTLQYCFYDKI